MEGNMHGWDFKALINSYNFIRLTNDEKSENGYLFTKTPYEAKDWFVEFQFEISSTGRFAGDGMAFWYTENPFQPGQAFGHDEKFKGLGVFFDTFRNGDHEVLNTTNCIYFNFLAFFPIRWCHDRRWNQKLSS